MTAIAPAEAPPTGGGRQAVLPTMAHLCVAAAAGIALPLPVGLGVIGLSLIAFLVLTFRVPGVRRGWVCFVTLLLAGFVANVAEVSAEVRLAGVMLVVAAALPLVVRPLNRSSDFPFVQLFGLVTLLYGAVGVLLARTDRLLAQDLDDSQRSLGMVLLALFLVAMLLGSVLVPRSRIDVVSVLDDVHMWRALALIALSYVSIEATDRLGLEPSLGMITFAFLLLRVVGFLALWWMFLNGRLPVAVAVPAAALVALDVVNGFGSTLLYSGLATPIAGLCLYVALRRRVPWAVLIVALVVAVFLNSVKSEMRQEIQQEREVADLTLTERGVELTSRSVSGNALDPERISDAAKRFSYASGDLMGYIASVTPELYPYWDKGTYKFVPLSVVPRVIAPWKPEARFANEFGQEYGLLEADDEVTSANLPISAEALVNFGVGGMVLVGVLYGVALGLASRLLRLDRTANHLLGALLCFQVLAGVESDSTIALGALPLVLLVFVPVTRWLAPRTPGSESMPDQSPTIDAEDGTVVVPAGSANLTRIERSADRLWRSV